MPFIIIVIYNKKIEDLTIFKQVFDEVTDIFIYDNSTNPQEIPTFENVNIYYEHDENNSGVSRAYNVGYRKSKELGKELLLLLDQDSIFEINFIKEYSKMYKQYKDSYIYAPIVTNPDGSKIYSPGFMKNFVGKVQNINEFVYEETYSLLDKSVINSGLMIPIEIFEKIGGFNEKLKLDFSDVYFIEKYKELNPKIVLLDVYLRHSISGDEGKNFAREYNRFKYYCSAAKVTSLSLNIRIFWSPFRRLVRLTLKYKNLKFVPVFYEYYIRGKQV